MASNFSLKWAAFTSFGMKERIKFYKKLSQLLKNGVSLDDSLSQMAVIQRKRGRTGFANLLIMWRKEIANGKPLTKELVLKIISS